MVRFRGALLVGLFLFCIAVPSGNAQTSNTAWIDAIWIAKTDGLLKMATADGTPLFEIGDAKDIRALAVDNEHGHVWGLGPGNLLRIYKFDGSQIADIAVPLQAYLDLPIANEDVPLDLDYPLPTGAGIEVVGSQRAWLFAGDRAFLYDVAGSRYTTITTLVLGGFKSATHDADRSQLVFALSDRVEVRDEDSGNVLRTILMPTGIQALAVEFDRAVDAVWVATSAGLERRDPATDVIQLSQGIPGIQQLAADGNGGLWATTQTTLLRLDSTSGNVEYELSPFVLPTTLLALSSEKRDFSAWIASTAALRRFSETGAETAAHDFDPLFPVRALATSADLSPPEIAVWEPAAGEWVTTDFPEVYLYYADSGSGVDLNSVILQAAVGTSFTCVPAPWSSNLKCTASQALPQGSNTLSVIASDYSGNLSAPSSVTFWVDSIPPVLTIFEPSEGALTNNPALTIRGEVSEPAGVYLNGSWTSLPVAADLSWETGVTLTEGSNSFLFEAWDPGALSSSKTLTVFLDSVLPGAPTVGIVVNGDGTILVQGTAEPGSAVTIRNPGTGESVQVTAGADGSYSATLHGQAEDQVSVTARDPAGNVSAATTAEVGGTFTPADPALVASPIDPTVPTDFAAATTFLYRGLNRVQTGVYADISPTTVSVVRGRALTTAGVPIEGARVAVHLHPEFGSTRTRADGRFDIAMTGGQHLTIQFQKAGFISLHRQVDLPWRDFEVMDDVRLSALDTEVTFVDMTATTSMQVARASVTSDLDGARQATVLVEAGTLAEMVMPNGSRVPLDSAAIRITEFTVGTNGRMQMPASLPRTTAYTYAAEFSIDEAMAAGANEVSFSKPVFHYLENFLEIPTGYKVPSGYYDRAKATWIASPDGRVVEVASISGGLADLIIDTSGIPAGAAALSALGVTEAERATLATLYTPGDTLWRVPLSHFSIWDLNYPFEGYGPPDPRVTPDHRDPEPVCGVGSIIECENQTLRETIGVPGTPYSLSYASDRVFGRVAARTLDIQVSGDTVPSAVQKIESIVFVGGRRFQRDFEPLPNQSYTFTWDGLDVYGRRMQGEQKTLVQVNYKYPQQIFASSTSTGNSFGNASSGTMVFVAVRESGPYTPTAEYWTHLGTMDQTSTGLGGLSISPVHTYSSVSKTLYRGDGGRRQVEARESIVHRVAGQNGGENHSYADGAPARGAAIIPIDVVAAPDGGFVFTELSGKIGRVTADGIIVHVAGHEYLAGFSGDGGPATDALIDRPEGIALGPDGSIYFVDSANLRVRRITPDGIIRTVAGNGSSGSGGDGGPATSASFISPRDIAVASDGTFYVTDRNGNRIRRVGTDGIINTYAGTGDFGFSGDGGPARLALISWPDSIAVEVDGSVVFTDFYNWRVRRISTAGTIVTIAGGPGSGSSRCEGCPATDSVLIFPRGIAVGLHGEVFVFEPYNASFDFDPAGRIRRISRDGRILTVAGTSAAFANENEIEDGAASGTRIGGPALDVAADGSIFLAQESVIPRVLHIKLALPSPTGEEFSIVSEEGRELYLFSEHGRHLETRDTLTNIRLLAFGYDSAGRLITIDDRDGKRTTIERNGSGAPTAIVAPGGQRTTLGRDANGLISSVSNEENESVQLAMRPNGLLDTFKDPKNQVHTMTWNALGLLEKDEDPEGGYTTLAKSGLDGDLTVTKTSALGRTTTIHVDTDDRRILRTTTSPAGIVSTDERQTDGGSTNTSADGTITSTETAPDPRFGAAAEYVKRATITTPGGRNAVVTQSRNVTLSDPNNPLSLTASDSTVTVNGRSYLSSYTQSTRTLTTTSPAGRQATAVLDAKGRVVQAQAGGLAPVSLTYDSRGRLQQMTRGSGAIARTFTRSYNSRDELSGATDSLSRTTTFNRDLAGRATLQTLPGARQVSASYDDNGNITALVPPGKPSHGFDHTAVDLASQYTPPAVSGSGANVTDYEYSLDKELKKVTRPDLAQVTVSYHATSGRPTAITHTDGAITVSYESGTGRIASLVESNGQTLSYGYDGFLPLSETWSGTIAGAVSRTYDDSFRLASETAGGVAVGFSYDDDSLLTGAGALAMSRHAQSGLLTGSTHGVVSTERQHNPFGEPTLDRATISGTETYRVEYTRDAKGRIASKSETMQGATAAYAYTYDSAGRLALVTKDGVETSAYAYDLNGNRLSRNTIGGTVSATLDDQDRLLTYGGTSYAYSANGELRTKTDASGTTTFDYDALGNLRRVDLPGGGVIEYVIDARNRRVGKKVGGVLVQAFLYRDQLEPVAELDGAGNVVARFVYGTKGHAPDYMVKGGVTYRIVSDHLGSPRLVVDVASGAVAQRIDFDEFGNVTADSNPGFQPFGFAGGVFDPHSKLTRFGARDYSPVEGRWTAKDPIGFRAGLNFYAYCHSDPINRIDPNGLRNDFDIRDDIWESYPPPIPMPTSLPSGAIGISLEGSTINPITSRGGGTFGINLEYTSSCGVGLYRYWTPSNAPSTGFLLGIGVQGNVAIGEGPWTGLFENGEAAAGPVGFGYFHSPMADQDAGYFGVTGGVGLGPPYGLGFSTTNYAAEAGGGK